MASKRPSYTQDNLTRVGEMTSQIATAAARYGVPAEAIAGALAQELSDQKASLMNCGRMVGSAAAAHAFLDKMFIEGLARNPFHPTQGASDTILDKYNADPNAMTVGSALSEKAKNGLLVDYGPAGMKFQNAIRAILSNPDDPAFAPYVKDLLFGRRRFAKGQRQSPHGVNHRRLFA